MKIRALHRIIEFLERLFTKNKPTEKKRDKKDNQPPDTNYPLW